MPISHTCPSCCAELGHLRAVPDPHYGLGVIVCPRCTHAVVRVRHPDRVFWQQMRRLRKGLFQLWLANMFAALATGATIGMAFWLLPQLTSRAGRYKQPDIADPSVPAQIIVAVIMLLLCGIIARVVYAHLRFRSVLVLFLVLIGVFCFIDAIIGRLILFALTLGNAVEDIGMPTALELKRRSLMLPLVMPVFVLGMIAGGQLNRLIERGSGKRIVRIRRRLRNRQARLD
ncbi:MAG: hypothetical protein R3B67_08700 [Phycisphaerales bacterium]